MKRALITGINGFVGPYLRQELESNGYFVVGLGREKKAIDSTLKYYPMNITDKAGMEKILKKIRPTHIFHLAGISSPPIAEQDPENTFDVHVNGTEYLLAAADKLSHKPKIAVISSAHVYGDPQYLPVDENHPLAGLGVYGKSRIAQEEVSKKWMDKLFIVIPRSFNHTGAGQPDTFVIPKIFKQFVEIKKGLRDRLDLGRLDIKRDITDVRDVVSAYRLLLEGDFAGVVCNVCRGTSISLKEIVEKAKIIAGLPDAKVVTDPGLIRDNDYLDVYGDRSLLTSLTGWEPSPGYDKLFQDIYSYWEKHV